jgi:hypothetical protein
MKTTTHMDEKSVESTEAILFFTPFGYMFPAAARKPECLLEESATTIEGLIALGEAMGDPGTGKQPKPELDSQASSFFTYFGQFIDHDSTIRTDGDTPVSTIENKAAIKPVDPDKVERELKNGRRPFLDLDSLYGDGPSLSVNSHNESDDLYDAALHLKTANFAGTNKSSGQPYLDIPRADTDIPDAGGVLVEPRGLIADERNDENINVSQLHASFLTFHNAVYHGLGGAQATKANFIKARQRVRWSYQYIVIHQYLKTICDENVVDDTLLNGPRFLGAANGQKGVFMPLEFSVAAFRFGHSMIRSSYQINKDTELGIMEMLLPSHTNPKQGGTNAKFVTDQSKPPRPMLDPALQIDWRNYVGKNPVNKARKIDPLLAVGLFDLPTAGRQKSDILKHLAISNLLRGYSLSIPTGQAACQAFGIEPLCAHEIMSAVRQLDGVDPHEHEKGALTKVFCKYPFAYKTPLWFYILLEAHAQQDGERLGALGSRIVCETLIGMIKADPNSVLNQCSADITEEGIKVPTKKGISIKVIGSIEDMLVYSGFKI